MRYRGTLPRFLLNGSLTARLFIAIGSLLAFLVVFLSTPQESGLRNPLLFAIPVALVAWMFRKSGLFLTLLTLVISLWLYFSLTIWHTFWPELPRVFYFASSAFALLVIGLLINSQRNAFDLADEAHQLIYLAYEQQRKLHEAKDQFLQNINHELRTPLTAIYGYLELLLEHNDTLDDKMRITFLEHAMQSCDELQMLVNNVLDSMSENRGKQPTIHMEQTVVIDVVHEVLDRFDPKTLHEHTIRVDVPEYLVVMANPQYVRQVLRNLLSNAFKYAPAGTAIEINASLHGEVVDPFHPSPEIRINVKDYGPGIPPDEIPLLFNQFVRLRRDTSGRIRGSGLGLFLSKQFVTMMGGRIWVESEGIPGQGSRFHFTLLCVPRPSIHAQTKNEGLYIPPAIESTEDEDTSLSPSPPSSSTSSTSVS